jgi:hypothetical protein
VSFFFDLKEVHLQAMCNLTTQIWHLSFGLINVQHRKDPQLFELEFNELLEALIVVNISDIQGIFKFEA